LGKELHREIREREWPEARISGSGDFLERDRAIEEKENERKKKALVEPV
jgi:hypothetical protein